MYTKVFGLQLAKIKCLQVLVKLYNKTSKEGLSSDVTEHFVLSQSQMVYSFEISLWTD